MLRMDRSIVKGVFKMPVRQLLRKLRQQKKLLLLLLLQQRQWSKELLTHTNNIPRK